VTLILPDRNAHDSDPLKHNEVVPEKVTARFLEPMLLKRTDRLPEGNEWLYELKHDGYRGIAYKTAGKLYLRSRNDNDFSSGIPALQRLCLPFQTRRLWTGRS
jgi:ATP-dependent DNA ligase